MTEENEKKGIRLAKYIARCGLESRRGAEALIKAGKVTIDRKVEKNPAYHVDPDKDKVFVGRRRAVLGTANSEDAEVFVGYKPTKMVTTMSDPEGRPTVKDLLPDRMVRLFPVGRLDYDAEGALLFTSDGELANRLMHPRFHVPKVYMVKIKGKPENVKLEKLRGGVRLDDGRTKPCRIDRLRETRSNTWVEVELHEGRYRQLKRMFMRIRHPVLRIIRLTIGGVGIEGMEPGDLRLLTVAERRLLLAWSDESAGTDH
ncbi:MAG: pseudouridine synthase [Myxococcota bacterium]|nr:pseudouridine synthase [Myxococcota bacterium]